ncbi:MAG TPA: glycosyl transferase [Sediminispirochaeta sp.]|nr:glycosyl transferase [Sediminispirochaeta sp.]
MADQMKPMDHGPRRVDILGVPVDILPEEQIEGRIKALLDGESKQQILFLGLWDLLRARGKGDFARAVREAGLVIPTSKSILSAAAFLKKQAPHRYMPFSFVIKVLGVLEKIHGSVYLVGLKPGDLQLAASNLRDSFPGLHILGRYAGYFSPELERDVVMAIKKSAPSLLLTGPGVRKGRLWFLKNRAELPSGLELWCGECFKIFCGKRKKAPEKSWDRGTYWLRETLRHPWTLLRLFYYPYFLLLLLFARLSQKSGKAQSS